MKVLEGTMQSFNGATSFQKWIDEQITDGYNVNYSFNGATSFQKWIDGSARRQPKTHEHRFNGATSFQKWIEASWNWIMADR